jgi:predicted AAA+ superfamily ATPase
MNNTYTRDVLERHSIAKDKTVLDDLLSVVSSAVGSLTSPKKLADTFNSTMQTTLSPATVDRYLGYFEDAFLLEKAQRYDIKGRRYIGATAKYYYTDVGLRNARLNFRQLEENHIMENILYMDLRRRGYSVDVGIVPWRGRDQNGADIRKQLEVDFVATDSRQTYYIQSALRMDDEAKRQQELASLIHIPDSFKKIVVVRDDIIPWRDANGILTVGIEDFLLCDDLNDL